MGVTRNRQNFNWPSGSQTFWRYVIRSQKILCNYVNINWENNGKSNVRKHSPPSETDGCRLFPYICKPHRVFTPPSDKKVHLPWWLQRCPGPRIFPLVILWLQACSRIIQAEIIQTPFFHWWTPRPGGLGGLWLWQQQETWWVDNRNKYMWHCHKFGAPFVERNIKEVTNIKKQNNIYKKISGATGQQSC